MGVAGSGVGGVGLLLWRLSLPCRAHIGSGLSLLSLLLASSQLSSSLLALSVVMLVSSLRSGGSCAGAVQRSSSLLFRFSPMCVRVRSDWCGPWC